MMKFTKYITVLSLAVVFASCDSILETEPQQSVDPEIARTTSEGIESIVASAYNRLVHQNYYGRMLMLDGDVLADNAFGHPTTSGRYTGHPTNSTGTNVGGYFRYNQINDINNVIEFADEVDGLTDVQKEQFLGEMYFLRALAYHDLAKVYAYEPNHPEVSGWDHGVIIRTEPTIGLEEASDQRVREPVREVYNLIYSDLDNAIDYLSSSDRGSVNYGNLAATYALKARVSLYDENWQDAADYAELAMDEAASLEVGLADPSEVPGMFEANPNPESLFEVRISTDESVGVNESISSILTPPGHYDVLPAPELIDAFEDDDTRAELFPLDTDFYPNEGTDDHFVRKYDQTEGTYADNIPVIRYAEVLLTHAEAQYELGNEAEALDDVNELRTHRGIDEVELGDLEHSLFDEIFHVQRRLELAFEGHRWQDLKRRALEVPKSAETGSSPVSPDDNRILAPMPTSQMDVNENLIQNPGY